MFPPVPIGDDNPSRTRPKVTYGLIALNVLVYLLANVGREAGELEVLFQTWGFDAAHPISVQLVTALFLHANLLHLVGNMWILGIVGDNVEDKLGPWLYAAVYFLGGVLASWAFVIISGLAPDVAMALDVPSDGIVPLVGASGAIFAVMGTYAVFFPNARIRLLIWFFVFVKVIPVRAKWIIGAWFVQDLLLTILAGGPAHGGVATAAHVGGAAAGMLAALWLKPHVGGGGLGDAWDMHTGFASQPRDAHRIRWPGARRIRITPALPTESQLVGIEEAIVREVRAGRLRAAIDLYPRYEAMEREKPLPGDVQIDIAHEFFRHGLPREALEGYLRYLETDPHGEDAPEAAFRVGVLMVRQFGRRDEAVPWLRRAAAEHADERVRDFAASELARLGAA